MPAAVLALAVALALAPRAAAVPAVELSASKTHYALGETVEITTTNHLDEFISLNAIPYLVIVDETRNEVVLGCVTLPGISRIPPGISETTPWGQTSCSTGLPAGPGMYRASIVWWSEGYPEPRLVTEGFCIDSGCAPTGTGEGVAGESWGRVKARHRGRSQEGTP